MRTYKLRYKNSIQYSRKNFEKESLPISNSHIGVNVFSSTNADEFVITEESIWTGGPSSTRKDYNGGNIPESNQYLSKINDAIKRSNIEEISNYANKLVGLKDGYGSFQTFCRMKIQFQHSYKTDDFNRELNLNCGVARATTTLTNSSKIDREYLVSYIDDCMQGIVTSDETITSIVSFKFLQEGKCQYDKNKIIFDGEVLDNGLKIKAVVIFDTDGRIDFSNSGEVLIINDYRKLSFRIVIKTDYLNRYPDYRRETNLNEYVDNILLKIDKISDNDLRLRHINDFHKLFVKKDFVLSREEYEDYTDNLLKLYKFNINNSDKKSYLEELLFHFSKYILISTSRTGSLPINLQGKFNDNNDPIWGSDYHLNINLQMAYSSSGILNLTHECAEPFLKYIKSLSLPGRVTAQCYSNIKDKDAWFANTQSTIFGWTCPGWEFEWGWCPEGIAWAFILLFEIYDANNIINEYISTIYDEMKGFAQYIIGSLLKDDNGFYKLSPTYSPEHGPITTGNTFSDSLIKEFIICMLQSYDLKHDSDTKFYNRLNDILNGIEPLKVLSNGELQEWPNQEILNSNILIKKKYSVEKFHRHISNLVCVYPCDILENNQKIKNACLKTINNRRKLPHVQLTLPGWAHINDAILYAKLGDKQKAKKSISIYIKNRVSNNLLGQHPPFQIDSTLGYAKAMFEIYNI